MFRRGIALLISRGGRAGRLELPLPRNQLCIYPWPCACCPAELGLEVGVCVTFRLGSAGERLPVIPTAVCHDGPGQPPSSTLAFLNEAPDCVQGTADLEGEHSTWEPACWAVRAGGESPFLQPPLCPGKHFSPRAGWQEPRLLRGLVGVGGK